MVDLMSRERRWTLRAAWTLGFVACVTGHPDLAALLAVATWIGWDSLS